MNQRGFIYSATIGALILFCGCGARTKSAADVSGIFSGNSISLNGLMTGLCQNLRNRADQPNMSKASLSDEECARSGNGADNYKTVTEKFYFEGLESQVNKESGKDVLHIKTRGKVWLNQNILNLALKLTKAFQARKNGGADPFSKPTPAGAGGDKLASLIKTKVTELKKIEFDQATKSFGGKINLTAEGLATLNNDIEIIGQIFAESIAINVNSSNQVDFKSSLIRDVNAVGIITPYANDVYLDVTFEINVHSIGLNNLLTSKIESALGGALKSILDSLLKIDE